VDDPKLFTLDTAVHCPKCQAMFPPSEENFASYFAQGEKQRCPSCKSQLNWWAMVVDALASGFLGLQFAPIRAQATYAQVVMQPGTQASLDLGPLGVPDTARVLYVNYTPGPPVPKDAEGTLMPLEIHSNTPDRQVSAKRPLALFPMPLGGAPPDQQPVSVLIVWVDQASLGIPEAALLTAVEALHQGRYPEAIVSATAAVEVSLEPLLSDFLETFADSTSTREFLRRSNLAGQSDVLLPMVCGALGASPLPPDPAKAFRELRRLRNKAAHEGHLPDGTTRQQLAEAVASAIFAVEHIHIVGQLAVSES